MRYEVMTISPIMAQGMLESNYEGNRKVNKRHVEEYAEMMRQGTFNTMNGDTLKFGPDGTLYDGQHRLMAQVLAQVTLDYLCVTLDDPAACFKTMDNGKVRGAATFYHEEKNSTVMLAIAKNALCISDSEVPLLSAIQGKMETVRNATRVEITSFCDEHIEEMRELASTSVKMRHAFGCGPQTAYGTFVYLVRFCGDDLLLDDFIGDCCETIPSSPTVQALLTKVRKTYLNEKKPSAKWVIGTLLDAYDHFSEMDDGIALNKQTFRLKKYDKLLKQARDKKKAA